MSVPGSLKVAGRALQSAGRLAFDALAEPFGCAIPLSPERVATPRYLTALLREHGVDPSLRRLRVRGAKRLDVRSVSSNCTNSVLAIESEGSEDVALPESLFMKQPAPELLTRGFCTMIRIWELECRFYRAVAPRLPIRTPAAYAVARRGTRFVMLLENLHADPEVQLFSNPDMLEGPSIEQARRCLAALAKLHASFSDLSPTERETLLPRMLHPYLSPHMREVSKVLGAVALEPCRKKAPHLLTQEHVDLVKSTMKRWDALLDWWYREPLTLAHGDSHLGNFFLHGEEVGMLDWQAVQWGKGIRDVQYFLIDSLPANLLASHEEELVRYYLAELAGHGVSLPFEEAWEQYRAYSFQTLITIVVSIGSGSMVGMDRVMEQILVRSLAAIERLRFAEWADTHLN